MNVLIVESSADLGRLWQRHLEQQGAAVSLVANEATALDYLRERHSDIIVMDLALRDGNALIVADFASYRWPDTPVIFVTGGRFFNDGSIFVFAPNACACMPSGAPPEDLAAMVEYYAEAS